MLRGARSLRKATECVGNQARRRRMTDSRTAVARLLLYHTNLERSATTGKAPDSGEDFLPRRSFLVQDQPCGAPTGKGVSDVSNGRPEVRTELGIGDAPPAAAGRG